jgi:uncharacterized glyoxalase superfamily protein PhnB
MYIPEGYGTVFPYMVVNQAEKFVDFLKNAFGAKEIGRTTLPGGRIANSRVRIGPTTFMVSEANGESLKAMPATFPPELRDCLWHTTTPNRYESILRAGSILPNPDIPESDRWKTAHGPL